MGPALSEMNWKQHTIALTLTAVVIVGGLAGASGAIVSYLLGRAVAGLVVGYGLIMVFGSAPESDGETETVQT